MSHNDMTTAQKNLKQAAEIEKSSAWSRARLIAASVEDQDNRGGVRDTTQGKVSFNAASSVMAMDKRTIRSYLDAWNAAAADGLCAPSSDLTPDDGWTADMPDAADWEKYKQGNSHSAPRKVETVPAEPATATQQWTPEQKREVVRQLITEDPEVATVAREAAMPFPMERSERHEEFTQASRRAQKTRAAEDSKSTGIDKWLRATEYIGDAERHEIQVGRIVQTAIDFLSTRNFKGEAHNLLDEAVVDLRDRTRANLDKIEALHALLSEGATDWDAALTQLTGGDL